MADKQKYRARNEIYYISTRTGVETHVDVGDVFDDMRDLSVRHELDAGNIEEVAEEAAPAGGEK